MAIEPSFIVADEPVLALDVIAQAQVINLMGDLQRDLGLTMVFITHDMAGVGAFSNRVIVMYLGKIIQSAPAKSLSLPCIPTPRP